MGVVMPYRAFGFLYEEAGTYQRLAEVVMPYRAFGFLYALLERCQFGTLCCNALSGIWFFILPIAEDATPLVRL